MHKVGILAMGVLMILLTAESANADEAIVSCEEINAMKGKLEYLEEKLGQDNGEKTLSSVIAGLDVTGGISAGWFYTSHTGEDSSDNEWLLSNLLIEISQKDKTLPVGFAAAIGETSTPALLSTSENTNDIHIEYASLTLTPIDGLTAEVGLLQPNAGYENTYTFNNSNTFLGAVASQQPYNAYGGRFGYDIKGIYIYGGYYRNRLDDGEYVAYDSVPDKSWELGISGKIFGADVSVYNYHLENLRVLTGAVIQRTVSNVDLALNVDYWRWDGSMKSAQAEDDSIGGALYVVPHFGKFTIPLRLEYIDQGKSGIYLDSVNAKQIYSTTLSPTYNILDNAYVRADIGYVHAKDGFTDNDGNTKSYRVCLAVEIGYTF
jgi:hypothetical protein